MKKDFEAGVLAYLVRRPRILLTYRDILAAYHFEYTPLRNVATVLLSAVTGEGFKAAPTQAELHYLADQTGNSQNWALDLRSAIHDAVNLVYSANPTKITQDHISEFISRAERRAIGESLVESKPDAKATDLHTYLRRLKTLANIASDDATDPLEPGRNFFGAGPDGLEQTLADMSTLYDPSVCFPTGWRLLDGALLGGVRPKEGNVILGPTNGGKTETLIQFMRIWNSMGKRGIWYGADSTIEEMAERNITSQTGVPIDPAKPISDRVEHVRKVAMRHDLCWFREWSPNKHRVSDIRHHLHNLRETVYHLDIANGYEHPGEVHFILVDSPQLMLPEGKRSAEARRFDLADIYYDLLALLKEENLIGIFTHQVNRVGLTEDFLDLTHISEALAAMQPMANIFGLPHQSIMERAERTRRIQFLKLRKPEGIGKQVRMKVDRWRQLMWEDPEQDELSDAHPDAKGETAYRKGKRETAPETAKADPNIEPRKPLFSKTKDAAVLPDRTIYGESDAPVVKSALKPTVKRPPPPVQVRPQGVGPRGG